MIRRPYLSLLVPVLGVALLTGSAASGEPKRCPATGGATACPAPVSAFVPARCCPPTSPENAKLVEELRTILQETSSSDTFLLTVKALADIGPDAKATVPVIIRGAERLGLLKDLVQQAKDEDGPGMMIVDCIEQIIKGPACFPACPPAAVYAVPPAPFALPCCPAAGGVPACAGSAPPPPERSQSPSIGSDR
ncbi:MAG TPA: hypothetical protein VNK04_20615 [Gemmataceae bacterium]|nr:hypothetical protein [Gemmataceae bacterium]